MSEKICLVFCTHCKHKQQAFVNHSYKYSTRHLCFYCGKIFTINKKNVIKVVPKIR